MGSSAIGCLQIRKVVLLWSCCSTCVKTTLFHWSIVNQVSSLCSHKPDLQTPILIEHQTWFWSHFSRPVLKYWWGLNDLWAKSFTTKMLLSIILSSRQLDAMLNLVTYLSSISMCHKFWHFNCCCIQKPFVQVDDLNLRSATVRAALLPAFIGSQQLAMKGFVITV